MDTWLYDVLPFSINIENNFNYIYPVLHYITQLKHWLLIFGNENESGTGFHNNFFLQKVQILKILKLTLFFNLPHLLSE